MTIVIGIQKRLEDEGDYRVFWRKDGKDDEGKAYYTNDPEDAVGTMVALSRSPKLSGTYEKIEISQDKKTMGFLSRFQTK